MPKSHKRGGAKAHNKRVAARNAKIKTEWKRISKQAWENQNNESLSGLIRFEQKD